MTRAEAWDVVNALRKWLDARDGLDYAQSKYGDGDDAADAAEAMEVEFKAETERLVNALCPSYSEGCEHVRQKLAEIEKAVEVERERQDIVKKVGRCESTLPASQPGTFSRCDRFCGHDGHHRSGHVRWT